MKTIRLRFLGPVIFAAVVLTGLMFLRLSSNDPAPADVELLAPPKDQPSLAATASPSPPRLAQPALVAPKSPVSAPASTQLWAAPSETSGAKLDPKSAAYLKAQQAGVKPEGRSSPFDPGSVRSLAALQRGDSVVIPLLGGEQVTGKVNLVQPDDGGWVRVGGELTGPRTGSFAVSSNGKEVGGTILLPQEEIAYAITGQSDSEVLMQEKHLSEVICFPLPRPNRGPIAAALDFGQLAVPPVLSSRPGASAVLYLDFDGATVTGTSWNSDFNSGNPIVALPSALSTAGMAEVWNRVKEDFWPFNIDVTTDVTRYNSAAVGKRMRCIISPTCAWYDCGVGGVAYLNSFDKSGSTFSSTIPCWVFESSSGDYPSDISEAVSHELGHTLGLSHDGGTVANSQTQGPPGHENEYYKGHGTGAVGWAPIMGVGYYQALTQWSKGEYANANNHEDDLAIIANAANGFGYMADDAGNSRETASPLLILV